MCYKNSVNISTYTQKSYQKHKEDRKVQYYIFENYKTWGSYLQRSRYKGLTAEEADLSQRPLWVKTQIRPPRVQTWVRDSCGNRPEPATSEKQSWVSYLSWSRPEVATSTKEGLSQWPPLDQAQAMVCTETGTR